jgi:hypothetical protein
VIARARAYRLLLAAAFVAVATAAGCGLTTYGDGDPTIARCATDAQCDDQNLCTDDTCSPDGACSWKPRKDALVVLGDCHAASCTDGQMSSMIDDTDVPDDHNDCTHDACDHGVPSSAPVGDGEKCTTHGAVGACAAGSCVVACGAGKPPCPDGDPCTTAVCDLAAGACAFTPLDGVPVPGHVEKSGDCAVFLCVAGAKTSVEDATDVPVTKTDCDQEVCDQGAPKNPPKPEHTACATSGGHVCSAGACVECIDKGDCLANGYSDNDCRATTCVAGKCGYDFQPTDAVPPGLPQTAGDCLTNACDGKGATKAIPAPADNDDHLECTVDSCVNNAAVHTPSVTNTACGNGGALYCDGAGACVNCTQAAQCGVADACKTPVCNGAHVCAWSYVADGTLAGAQVAGDCQKNVCDGAGNLVMRIDNADAPPSACESCVNGAVHIDFDKPCALGLGTGFCSATATCVACNATGECPAIAAPCQTAACVAQACTAVALPNGTVAPAGLQTSGDCKLKVCVAGAPSDQLDATDLPNDANPCTNDSCVGTTPTHTDVAAGAPPVANGTCAPLAVCDGAGTCVACNAPGDCVGVNQACVAHACCTKTTCAAAGVSCGVIPDGCGGTIDCGGAKNGGESGVDCGGPIAACAARCAQGVTCSIASDCATGSCVDGVCCNSACGGACQGCISALTGKADGLCQPVLAGMPDAACVASPATSCGLDGICDGLGACALWPSGTSCAAAPSCVGSTVVTPTTCDGAGTCSKTTVDCGIYACVAGACTVPPCAADADCSAGYICDQTIAPPDCQTPHISGDVCTRDPECLSGTCLGGGVCQ